MLEIVNHASELKGETIFSMNDEEKDYFYKTFGNIADEIYIEKIVPQWQRPRKANKMKWILQECMTKR